MTAPLPSGRPDGIYLSRRHVVLVHMLMELGRREMARSRALHLFPEDVAVLALIDSMAAERPTDRPLRSEPAPVEWITVREAAERAGVTDRQIRLHAASGRFDQRRKGGRILVDAAEVDAYYADRKSPEAIGIRDESRPA